MNNNISVLRICGLAVAWLLLLLIVYRIIGVGILTVGLAFVAAACLGIATEIKWVIVSNKRNLTHKARRLEREREEYRLALPLIPNLEKPIHFGTLSQLLCCDEGLPFIRYYLLGADVIIKPASETLLVDFLKATLQLLGNRLTVEEYEQRMSRINRDLKDDSLVVLFQELRTGYNVSDGALVLVCRKHDANLRILFECKITRAPC